MSDFETSQIRGIIQGLGPPTVDPATTLATTFYRDRDPVTGGYYQCMPDGAGVNAWVPVGPAAASMSWPKYVVSNQPTPEALYSTIQSAIDAAYADGHGAAFPAVVLVLPGKYVEDLTLPEPGIAVTGSVGAINNQIQVVGSITCTDTTVAGGGFTFNNMFLQGGPLTVTGTQPTANTILSIGRLAFQQDVGGLVWNAYGTTIIDGQCVFIQGPAVAIDYVLPANIFMHDVFFPNGSAVDAVRVRTSGIATFRGCDVFGRMAVLAGGNVRVINCTLNGGGGVAALDLAAGSDAIVALTSVSSDAPFAITGAGRVALENSPFTGPAGFLIAPTVDTTGLTFQQYFHKGQTVGNNGGAPIPFPPTLDTLAVVMGGIAVTVQLPALANVPDGTMLTVKGRGALGSLTLDGLGAPIDGAATVTVANAYPSLVVVADRVAGTWSVVGAPVVGGLGKYTVAPVASGLGAAYPTVAAAQAAATADGHGPGNPTTIRVLADLTEDLALVPGLNLQGLGVRSPDGGQPTITGSMSLGPGSGIVAVSTLTLFLEDGPSLDLGGVDNVVVELTGVVARRTVGTVVLTVSNTGISSLVLRDCDFATSDFTNPGEPVVEVLTGGSVTLAVQAYGTAIGADAATQYALASDVPVDLTGCDLVGQLRFAGVVAPAASSVRATTVATTTQPAVELNGASLRADGGSLTTSGGATVVTSTAGPAQVVFVDVAFPDVRGLGPNLVPFTGQALPLVGRPHTRQGFGAAFGVAIGLVLTLDHAEDCVVLDSTGFADPRTVRLPLVASVPDGHRQTIAHVLDTGTLQVFSVAPQGADTINYGAIATVKLPIDTAATFQADAAFGTWILQGGVV